MALKGPKVRARVGEQAVAGEVRPVTNRSLVYISVSVVVAVALATTAIIVASASTKKRVTVSTNTPQGVKSLATTSYREVANLPPLLRNAPGKSDPASTRMETASLSLTCTTSCTDGRYTGFAGKITLAVSGAQLVGTAHSSCLDSHLVLTAPEAITTSAKLPPALTGILTRTSTCPGAEVASPVTLRLTVG